MTASPQLRPLTRADFPFVDSLRALAGWNQTLTDWERFLAFDPDGSFLAEWDHSPAGVITTLSYGTDLAWLGMLLVHPDFRRRGVGRALLERAIACLRQRGVRCIKLDATPEGKPVYLKLGFQEEWTFTRWEGFSVALPPNLGLRPWEPGDAASLESLDSAAFGTSRRALLEALARQSLRALVLEPDGYGMIRAGSHARYLGPVVARTPEAGLRLVAALLHAPGPGKMVWDIPDQNLALSQWAQSQKFMPQRFLTRMFLGAENIPGRPEMQIAIAGPDLG